MELSGKWKLKWKFKIDSKLLLFSDNRTNQYLPSFLGRIPKYNQKNMYHKTWSHREQASVKVKLK